MTRDDLAQYANMQREVVEIQDKISRLQTVITKLESRIATMEDGEVVKDTVRGGSGGNQHFVVEGFPDAEYRSVRTELLTKKLILNGRKSTLDALEIDILQKTNEVEEFIASVSDSRIRRIINLRYIENKSWNEVAIAMGGGNNEDSVRKTFDRFMEKAESCPKCPTFM